MKHFYGTIDCNLQWRLLRTPVRVWRRTFRRRMFWHEIQNIVFPYTSRYTRLVAVTCSKVLNLAGSAWNIDVVTNCRCRWRWRLLFGAGICSCLFHLNIAMQLLQCYLICITVDDEDALFLIVVALITFEHRVRMGRAICDIKNVVKHMETFDGVNVDLPKWGRVTVTELLEPVWSVASLCTSTLAGLKSSVNVDEFGKLK